MFLPKEKFQHINSISHEGKIVIFGTDANGTISYTIKQDGFEDSYGHTEVTGWENWQVLDFPQEEPGDRSVIEKERQEQTYTEKGRLVYLFRSLYQTQDQTAAVPVQLVSGWGYIYVFRQSKDNTLLVDRFVLDGLENKLVRKLEIRYQRSRQKYQPLESPNENHRLSIDSLNFRDIDGRPFYEPTTELSLVNNLYNGWLAVVLLPTNEHDQYRWHIFAYNRQNQKIELTSIRSSQGGLFDIKDFTVLKPQPDNSNLLLAHNIPAILKRSLDIKGMKVGNGLAATKYNLQVERQTQNGELQLLKESTRVMLVVAAENDQAAAVSFAVAGDGTLAQIDRFPNTNTLRANENQVLLPLNLLDEIQAVGESMPAAQGTITGMERTQENRVKIYSPQAKNLKSGDMVEIFDTNRYNGYYVAKTIDANTFEIETKWLASELGHWKVTPQAESGLLFDGMVVAFTKTTDGKLRVTVPHHGLEAGDGVQIANTQAYNGIYTITDLNGDSFTIGVKWQPGEAVNLKLASKKRRGISFTSDRDYISLPALDLTIPQANISFGTTYSAWVSLRDRQKPQQLVLSQKDRMVQLSVVGGKAVFKAHFQDGSSRELTDSQPLSEGEWVHLAGIVSYDKTTKTTTLRLCKNGVEVAKTKIQQLVSPVQEAKENNQNSSDFSWSPEFCIGGSGKPGMFFAGKISDVQIWNHPRTSQEIQDSMHLQFTGREVGLVGYWRLGAIVEDKERRVVDFSTYGKDGTVYGEAFVSAVALSRVLRDGSTPAIAYINEELFAVSQRATYVESFECKGIQPHNFEIFYWGKSNRTSQERIEFTGGPTEFQALENGWYLASCRFTIPDGVSFLRSFAISNIKGNWQQLEIRKHRIRVVSDSITQANYTDSISLKTLDTNHADLAATVKQLRSWEQQETSLLQEKNALETEKEILQNKQKSGLQDLQKRRRQLEQQVKTYREKISQLQQEVNRCHQLYLQEANNPLNYYCYIASSESGKVWDIEDRVGRNRADIHLWEQNLGLRTQQWQFQLFNNAYWIVNRQFPAFVAEVEGESDRNKADIHLWRKDFSRLKQQWQLELSNQNYLLVNRRFNTRVASVESNPYSNKADVHLWEKTSTRERQQWRLERTNDVVNNEIANAKKALEQKQQQLKQANRHLQYLTRQLALLALENSQEIEEKLKLLKERLQQVIAELQTVQTTLHRLNDEFLQSVFSIQNTPQTMSEIAVDANGLATQAGWLGFVSPISRIHATETSEGNVQLSYFDSLGRMRQSNYDATSDSRNAAFQQWIPDSMRACPHFDKENSMMLLENAIALDEEWTIEAWFFYPFPATNRWNTLTRAKHEADHHIIVTKEGQLGTYVGDLGGFQDSGYHMEQLDSGWHHIAAAAQGKGEQAKTVFYIDGNQVGTCQGKSKADVYAIGNYQEGKQPFGKLAEVRIWQVALSAEEIEVNSQCLLSGNEPGLLAYYPMNEATGTEIRDRSGNSRHGQLQSTTWFACTALFGHPGHAVMQFDGENDYIDCGEVDFSRQEYSIEAWFKTTARTTGDILAATTSEHGILLEVEGEGTVRYLHRYPIGISGGKDLRTQEKYNDGWWHHLAAVKSLSKILLYVDGELKKETEAPPSFGRSLQVDIGRIGKNISERLFRGKISDVRIWKTARSHQEIQATMHQRLTGGEPDLLRYWPLQEVNRMRSPYLVADWASDRPATVREAITTQDNTLPIARTAIASAEYSTVGIDPDTQRKSAIMRRFFAFPSLDGAMVLSDKLVEQLELKWIGNAQFEPTLLGYIEGAPPVPSENLTVQDNYNNATSVELTMSEDIAYSWNRNQEAGLGASLSATAGTAFQVSGGFILEQEAEAEAGITGQLSSSYSFLNQSDISASSGSTVVNRLSLRGSFESAAKFPHLGQRFVPKNIGYALVVSSLADVYITRLRRSKKMVAYQVQPNEQIPPQVNTITFLMNPAYVLNGSLDGLIGSVAADERFYRDVPQMRSQYGSLYPASYYRLQQAYEWEQQIEQQDRERASYFANFNSRLVDEISLNRQIEADGLDRNPLTNTEGDPANIDGDTLHKNRERQKQESQQKRNEISTKVQQQEKRIHAIETFANWQRKLENLQIRAGKRNIVNHYVWDADGGLRSESQQFASTVEHTIGGAVNFEGAIGGKASVKGAGVLAELEVLATVRLTQTLTKTERRSQGFALHVDLENVESAGVTDTSDRPLLPGEKVDRYHLKSFYLEGNTQHFHDFFAYVVDPEWLASNSEEARALRQTQAGRANKTWRILHRVTYVERPALMGFGGFGENTRPLSTTSQTPDSTQLIAKIEQLEQSHQALEQKLDYLLQLLRSNLAANKPNASPAG